MTGRLVADDEIVMNLEFDRYMSAPSPAERELLRRAPSPVLDVGCGPGRHVMALAESGRLALGVDVAPSAVDIATKRGAPVLLRSVFERIPAAGRWASALLLDGNIGIGGNPQALLARLAELVRWDGCVLAEVEPPGTSARTMSVRIEWRDRISPAFPWARVGVDDIGDVAARAGYQLEEIWSAEHRWFAHMKLR
ncbi:MAG: class I SAM-dependent methyltransferase [Actinomycetota bacterium]